MDLTENVLFSFNYVLLTCTIMAVQLYRYEGAIQHVPNYSLYLFMQNVYDLTEGQLSAFDDCFVRRKITE